MTHLLVTLENIGGVLDQCHVSHELETEAENKAFRALGRMTGGALCEGWIVRIQQCDADGHVAR
jgi:hypothetical protein